MLHLAIHGVHLISLRTRIQHEIPATGSALLTEGVLRRPFLMQLGLGLEESLRHPAIILDSVNSLWAGGPERTWSEYTLG
jgi:hypothetical protein